MQKVIVRTSQPLCGPQFRRCREDERMFAAILGKDRRGFIIDTRTQVWQIKLIYTKFKFIVFWGEIRPRLIRKKQREEDTSWRITTRTGGG